MKLILEAIRFLVMVLVLSQSMHTKSAMNHLNCDFEDDHGFLCCISLTNRNNNIFFSRWLPAIGKYPETLKHLTVNGMECTLNKC